MSAAVREVARVLRAGRKPRSGRRASHQLGPRHRPRASGRPPRADGGLFRPPALQRFHRARRRQDDLREPPLHAAGLLRGAARRRSSRSRRFARSATHSTHAGRGTRSSYTCCARPLRKQRDLQGNLQLRGSASHPRLRARRPTSEPGPSRVVLNGTSASNVPLVPDPEVAVTKRLPSTLPSSSTTSTLNVASKVFAVPVIRSGLDTSSPRCRRLDEDRRSQRPRSRPGRSAHLLDATPAVPSGTGSGCRRPARPPPRSSDSDSSTFADTVARSSGSSSCRAGQGSTVAVRQRARASLGPSSSSSIAARPICGPRDDRPTRGSDLAVAQEVDVHDWRAPSPARSPSSAIGSVVGGLVEGAAECLVLAAAAHEEQQRDDASD